ncbi:uncharacterized protein LOC8287381 [Ricinus communis]|uniref:Mitochondrial carrier protein, putative n=1 Tax=Ricinus communis TaxID=3988 RepID=B9RCC2_RICCO|nr:uncharacterized protein LOC8287381 [Ricinus communis]EEF51193.1 mitochondrial carrier protein, putative [Ricinus communis]|eukprot:XP_002509806.1 uncharacterized protein LOC8287381 [Ricinus communis]
MCGSKKPPPIDRPSITYKWNKVEKGSSGVADFNIEEHASKHSQKKNQSAEPKNPELLSTTELISAVEHIWDRVKEKPDHNTSGSQKNVILGDLIAVDVDLGAFKDDDGGSCFSVDVWNDSNITTSVQTKLEFLSVTQKMSTFEPCSKRCTRPLFSLFFNGRTKYLNKSWNGKGLPSLAITCGMERIYGWMMDIIPAESWYPVSTTKIIEDKKIDRICILTSTISHAEGCIPTDATHAGNNFASKSADFYCDLFKLKDASLDDNMKVAMKTGTFNSLCSNCILGALHDSNTIGSVSRGPSSSLYVDYHINVLVPHRSAYGTFQHIAGDNTMDENTRKKPPKFVAEVKDSMDIRALPCERPHYGLAKQEHAYAGAFAGVFVSLCLHPVDTIKTVTQSYRTEQKSICDIGRSIVSERGVTGLYRGIASNIASSAPISAIYTFTYESVKGSLLPLFSKEYHSLAHCIAGGSASVATSFVFTPSERIKQQMQIGSHYHNCWKALVGIIRNGGLPSLYTGWGAVLCRNVPHSIIKFYTYESLKQFMWPSHNSTAQPITLQTLVCGGLAGSTAALFTTPFDVVKTRLQIQIPGSMSKYDSVFHALKEIGKNEGLKGLYRGLIPRLVMYVSQGALFFASYESFKGFFSLEVPQFGAQRNLNKECAGGDSNQ